MEFVWDVNFKELLNGINVVSRDDGRVFTETARRKFVEDRLSGSSWRPIHRGLLTTLYIHHSYLPADGLLLLSSHIDSIYSAHWHKNWGDGELLGTLDNSITNAVVVDLMLRNRLAPNAIVAFTGDEEHDNGGAIETLDCLRSIFPQLWGRLECVGVMDVTAEGFATNAVSIENVFYEEAVPAGQTLRFNSEAAFRRYLTKHNGNFRANHVSTQDSDPDESWAYDEYDLNVFSICLPCAPVPGSKDDDWMHNDDGIRIKLSSLANYSRSVETLCAAICRDISVPS